MKDYKNHTTTKFLMLFTLAIYGFLPPVLTTYFCEYFNLNPFSIIKFWHFNPFAADRGIPTYQTFLYLLALWWVLNLALWLVLWAGFRGYARWIGPRR
ncbi:hypothetical protein [Serratia ficaria]|uniref:hypothetical protein n=1 Tax=Serratia ficaria TaxID=61651 RepID=UPI002178499E|nr:hypothetical protein [Serratia ficaria]CAI1925571.1 Uncharacterised protein [Serratia ficaria]